MRGFKRALIVGGLLITMTAKAMAYGGPGAAITLIGSLIGVGLAVFASLFYVIAWPLRRFLKKRKAVPAEPDPAEQQTTAAGEGAQNAAAPAQES